MSRINDTPIEESFLANGINIDISRLFPVVVMANMSSGKSTLINALLEKDILPSKNQACTAKIYSILDDDSADGYKIYVTKNNGHTAVIEKDLLKELEKANEDPKVENILVVGDIKGIMNTDKSLLVIDTPGPNNSVDTTHSSMTEAVLRKVNQGLIIYVINATQMGINDDKKLLSLLKAKVDNNKNISVLYVINKIDQLDLENESIEDFVLQTKQYVESNGLKVDNIIPVSALSANLFKKVLKGKSLTRKEKHDFAICYDLYKTTDIKMTSYAITTDLPDQFDVISLGKTEYKVSDIKAALDNTGLPYLEKIIQSEQIKSSPNDNIKVAISDLSDKETSQQVQNKQSKRKLNNKEIAYFSTLYDRFSIEYDQYNAFCIFKKNNRFLDTKSHIEKRIAAMSKQRLQTILLPQKDWNGLINEIARACEKNYIVLSFKGSARDFENLKYCAEKYSGNKSFELKFENCEFI